MKRQSKSKPKSSLHFYTAHRAKFTVHPKVKTAHKVWLEHSNNCSYINISTVDKYHTPVIRIIQNTKNKNEFYFFDNFRRMANIMQNEIREQQQFVIIDGVDSQITKMAWSEVLELCFYRDVNHPLLWESLKRYCAKTILQDLMVSDEL